MLQSCISVLGDWNSDISDSESFFFVDTLNSFVRKIAGCSLVSCYCQQILLHI